LCHTRLASLECEPGVSLSGAWRAGLTEEENSMSSMLVMPAFAAPFHEGSVPHLDLAQEHAPAPDGKTPPRY
jgi:hypothetical protein